MIPIRFTLDYVRHALEAEPIAPADPRSTLDECESDLSDLRWLEGEELVAAAIDLAERAVEGWRHSLSTEPVDQPARLDRAPTQTEA